MEDIAKQIAKLNVELKKKQKALNDELKRLNSEHSKKMKALTKGYFLCECNENELKYNPRTNKISDMSERCGCKAIYIPKTDFYFIEVEDYDIRNVGWDAGYGDYDAFAIFHTITKYRVCPKCGRCKFVSEKILEQSDSWARCERRYAYPKDFIPEDWKQKVTRIS